MPPSPAQVPSVAPNLAIDRLRSLEMAVLECAAEGAPLNEVLDQLVSGIEAQAEGLLGSIQLLDTEGQHLVQGAAPHLPVDYSKAIQGMAIGPTAGSCGTAAFHKRMVIVEDIATDPLWTEWRASALRHGLRACWSCPIFDAGDRVLGTFAFYHTEARQPTAVEKFLVEGAARVARLAILYSGTRDHLRLLGAAFSRLNDLVIITEAAPLEEPGPRIVFVNEAFERITGYRKEEALGRSPRFLNGPGTSASDLHRIHEALVARRPERSELLNYAKDGSVFWVELEVTPLAGHGSAPGHFVFVERDITQRKLSERILREQQRAMATLLSNLPGMAFRCQNDPAWTMEFVSDGCRALTGYDPAELVGNRHISYELVIEPEDREPVRTAVNRAVAKREPYEIAYRIRTRQGAVKWVWERGQGVFEGRAGVEFIEGFITDITERKLLEAQVVQSQRLESIGTLAGGIAHDLNNIFAPIIMAGDLLRTLVTAPPASRLLETFSVSAQRGAGLVRQILLFARGMEGRRIAVRPDDLFAEILPFLQTTLPKTIEVKLAVAPATPPILGDPTQLHQVLLNLCVNARDAMANGGRLTLSAQSAAVSPSGPRPHPDAMPGDYVRLDVADQGDGIAEEVRSRIFDPFFTTKDVGRGTGLGLSTARSIVKSHRGFITFKSAVGDGSTFSVMLPVAPSDAPPWRPDGASDGALGPGPCGIGQHILVVEDEESVRLIIRATLENFGFRVTAAGSAPEAIGLLTKDPGLFDLAIIGVQLPGLEGGEMIAALRKIQPNLPVISASGFATPKGQAQAEASGVTHFLDKPFSVETLLRTVNSALGQRAP